MNKNEFRKLAKKLLNNEFYSEIKELNARLIELECIKVFGDWTLRTLVIVNPAVMFSVYISESDDTLYIKYNRLDESEYINGYKFIKIDEI